MNEKKEKENENKKKKSRLSAEKKFYLFTAIGCAAVIVAILVVAIIISNASEVSSPTGNLNSSTIDTPTDNPQEPDDGENEPVVTVPEGMVSPVATVAILNDYGFYHNKTLNSYYEHAGIDFTAAAGTEVMAVESGVIESIYKEDILLGTEIVVNHGDGLKSVYRFVTEADGLKVGDKVEKGDVIATVAEATGNEYKDGAHLHFEIMQDGKAIDPALRLPLEEK